MSDIIEVIASQASAVLDDKGVIVEIHAATEVIVIGDAQATGAGIKGDKGDKGESGAGMPIGSFASFASAAIPFGYLPCDGRSLAVADYPVLYGLIGNTYGGNSLFFNLPKL